MRCVRHRVELHEAEAAGLPRELVPDEPHLLHRHRMCDQAVQPVLPARAWLACHMVNTEEGCRLFLMIGLAGLQTVYVPELSCARRCVCMQI